MIVFAAIKTIHKIVITNIPKSIRELIKNARKLRKNQMMSPAYIPKNNNYLNFYMIKGLKIYNSIPSDIKNKNPKAFKKSAKQWITENSGGISDTDD